MQFALGSQSLRSATQSTRSAGTFDKQQHIHLSSGLISFAVITVISMRLESFYLKTPLEKCYTCTLPVHRRTRIRESNSKLLTHKWAVVGLLLTRQGLY